MLVLWDITPCRMVRAYQQDGETVHKHHGLLGTAQAESTEHSVAVWFRFRLEHKLLDLFHGIPQYLLVNAGTVTPNQAQHSTSFPMYYSQTIRPLNTTCTMPQRALINKPYVRIYNTYEIQ